MARLFSTFLTAVMSDAMKTFLSLLTSAVLTFSFAMKCSCNPLLGTMAGSRPGEQISTGRIQCPATDSFFSVQGVCHAHRRHQLRQRRHREELREANPGGLLGALVRTLPDDRARPREDGRRIPGLGAGEG